MKQFTEELRCCFVLLVYILISMAFSLDFYNKAPLGSVASTAMLTPPKILECVKTVDYTLYSKNFQNLSGCASSVEMLKNLHHLLRGRMQHAIHIALAFELESHFLCSLCGTCQIL